MKGETVKCGHMDGYEGDKGMSETEQLLQALAQRNQNLGNMINAAMLAHQDNTAMLQRLADMIQREDKEEVEEEEE